MKKKILLILLMPFLISCADTGLEGKGELRISFTGSDSDITRAKFDIPDTSDFILTVVDSEGELIFEGAYGDSPESMMIEEGSYHVKVISEEFDRPEFSAPQFGDEQCVLVDEGSVVNVRLNCIQLNSGIRLVIDRDFLTSYPSSALLLKSDGGSLMYSYNEKRIAYFKPGKVSLILSGGSEDKVLMSRHLEPREILTLSVNASSSGSENDLTGSGMSIMVDTLRYWLDESFVIGESDERGDSEADALTVSQAKASVGADDVWVSGYIVGGDLTSTSASFEGPFESMTNILLGSRSSTRERGSCISVQLPSGEVREGLNLVENPSLLGRKVLVKGDIVDQYFGLVGIKYTSDFKIQ